MAFEKAPVWRAEATEGSLETASHKSQAAERHTATSSILAWAPSRKAYILRSIPSRQAAHAEVSTPRAQNLAHPSSPPLVPAVEPRTQWRAKAPRAAKAIVFP